MSYTDSILTVKFGEEMLQSGHTAIPNLVLNYYRNLDCYEKDLNGHLIKTDKISFTEIMLIIHIWQFWWNKQSPWPSIKTISEAMCIHERNVRKYISSLTKKYVYVSENNIAPILAVADRFKSNGTQTSNEYDFSNFIKAILFYHNQHKEKAIDENSKITVKPRNEWEGDIATLPPDDNITPYSDKNATPNPDNFTTPTRTTAPFPGGQYCQPNNTQCNKVKIDREIDRAPARKLSTDAIEVPDIDTLIQSWAVKWKTSPEIIRNRLFALQEQIEKGAVVDDIEAYIKTSVENYIKGQAILNHIRPPR